jgi:hypothetical protein
VACGNEDSAIYGKWKEEQAKETPDCSAIKGDPPSLKLWRTKKKLSQQFRRGVRDDEQWAITNAIISLF